MTISVDGYPALSCMHAPQYDTLHHELQHLVKDLKNCELALARKLAEMQTSGEFRRYASSMQG